MGAMIPFSAALRKSLRTTAGANELAAKAARAGKVKQMWRESVDQAFLDHTNAVYIVREHDEKILIVYVDDSIFAAELNARRELIKLKFLQRYNEDIAEFRILISRGRYKKNYPFRAGEEGAPHEARPPRAPLSPECKEELAHRCEDIGDERLRTALLKAMVSDLEWKLGSERQKGGNPGS